MKNNKHHGWANRDTWLVALHLDNVKSNYDFYRGYKKHLLKLKKNVFIKALKINCKFTDKINWNNVRVTEIKNLIREV